MLPASPPRFSTWAQLVAPIVEGETGWRPYALQWALRALGHELSTDGAFGPGTRRALKDYQRAQRLVADAIAGGATQGRMIEQLGAITHERLPGVPDGLMRGLAAGEGAGVLAATNWSVAGGVDCGTMQWRVYGPPYSADDLRQRFQPLASMLAAGVAFLDRAHTFSIRPWVLAQGARRAEWSKRLAVLAHNYPAGADTWSRTGTCSSPDSPATWAPPSARFPDGTRVLTRRDWCEFYACGGPHGEGAITRYIKNWN